MFPNSSNGLSMLLAALLLITGSMHAVDMKSTEENDSDNRESYKARRNDDGTETDLQEQDRPNCPADWKGDLPHPILCSHYYSCRGGTATLSQCDVGHLFDKVNSKCIDAAYAKCGNSAIDSEICKKQLDGFYPIYTEQCQQYYRCQGGNKVSITSCPRGQAFSFNHQTCLSIQLVSCMRPVCHREDNDFFWLPGTFCRAYYYCEEGQPLYFTCPEGLVFSRETKDCVKGGECYEPVCTGLTDGDHPDTTHGCQRSLQCSGGSIKSVTSCPPENTDHKSYRKTCFTTAIANCASPDTTAVSVETIRDDCHGYSDGPHVIQGTGCRRYQFCENGKALARMVCPKGLRFNGLSCAPKNATICEDPCTGKSDGYHADENEGCRKYHFCRSGETTERLSCPQGSLFSGHMCLPAPLVTCDEKPAPPVNPCIGLADGFHADYLNGCNTYFYCASYSSVLKTACPKNFIWNGKQCILESDSLCQGPVPHSDCHGLRTGLYQHQGSGCSKYFYCHNGNRTLLVCQRGKIFDGENCVNKEDYTCPSQEPDTCFNETDGYRINKDSGCTSYYYCTNGKKVTYVCPGSQVFNGTSCTSPTKFSCPYVSHSCHEKKDGYYPDFTSSCRKYFYCRKGNKMTTFNCGTKKVFDGERCTFATNSTEVCHRLLVQQNEEVEQCQGSPSPKQIQASNCTSYQYCTGGKWVTRTCPGGTIFNGKECLNRSLYSCPISVA